LQNESDVVMQESESILQDALLFRRGDDGQMTSQLQLPILDLERSASAEVEILPDS